MHFLTLELVRLEFSPLLYMTIWFFISFKIMLICRVQINLFHGIICFLWLSKYTLYCRAVFCLKILCTCLISFWHTQYEYRCGICLTSKTTVLSTVLSLKQKSVLYLPPLIFQQLFMVKRYFNCKFRYDDVTNLSPAQPVHSKKLVVYINHKNDCSNLYHTHQVNIHFEPFSTCC